MRDRSGKRPFSRTFSRSLSLSLSLYLSFSRAMVFIVCVYPATSVPLLGDLVVLESELGQLPRAPVGRTTGSPSGSPPIRRGQLRQWWLLGHRRASPLLRHWNGERNQHPIKRFNLRAHREIARVRSPMFAILGVAHNNDIRQVRDRMPVSRPARQSFERLEPKRLQANAVPP